MKLSGVRARTGHAQQSWPVLLLLLLVVLAPTVCLLWLMSEATRNERLAVRQRLSQAYRAQLIAAAHLRH